MAPPDPLTPVTAPRPAAKRSLASTLARGAVAVAEALLLVAILAAPWPYGSATDTARYALTAVIALAVAIWAVASALSRHGAPLPTAPVLALSAFALLQIALGRTVSRLLTAEAALMLVAMGAVTVFWSARAILRGPAYRAAIAVLAICFVQGAFGAVQWSIDPTLIYDWHYPSPFASYVSHNHFAGLVEMGAVLAAALALGHRRRHHGLNGSAIALGGLALGLTAVHLASRSRGGVIGLVAGLMALAALWPGTMGKDASRRALVPGALLAAAALAFGLLVLPAASRRHLATMLEGPSDASGVYRVDIAIDTLRLFASRPLLGCGVGAYEDGASAFKRRHGEVRSPHAESDLLTFLAEGGLAGLAIACWISAVVLRAFRRRMREGRDPLRKALAVGALAAVAGLLVHGLVDFNLRIPANALLFATLLGVAAAPREAPPPAPRAAFAGLALLLVLVAALASWRAVGAHGLPPIYAIRDPGRRIEAVSRLLDRHPYLAEAYRVRAAAWRDLAWRPPRWVASRLARAEADLRRATALRPHWGNPWAELGWILYFQGRQAEAEKAFERAAALDPTFIDIGLARADFLARTGRVEAAVAAAGALRDKSLLWRVEWVAPVVVRWTKDPALLATITDGSAAEAEDLARAIAAAP